MLSICADNCIVAYQRYISPYKGFRCAYHAHTGQLSCSAYARVIVRRLGVLALLTAMPRQFKRCRAAYLAILADRTSKPRAKEKKRNWDCSAGDMSNCLPNDCELPCHLPAKVLHCEAPCDMDVGACDCSL